MSLTGFERVLRRYPQLSAELERLRTLVERPSEEPRELTFERIFGTVSPISKRALTLLLAECIHEGILSRIIRVNSPATQTAITEYSSIEEVPEQLLDRFTGEFIEVLPERLEVVYKTPT